ncbi:MAG: sodium:proton symporter [Pseudomonadota bacterium]
MTVLSLPVNILSFLGRHGTIAIALSLLVGMALPFLAASVRPFLDEAVLTLLTMSFMRIGFRAIGSELMQPVMILVAVVVAMLVLPAGVLWIGHAIGLNASHPDLYIALFIALAVPPVAAVPIFAGLLRLPGAPALAFLIVCIVATPFAASLHARLFFSAEALPFDGATIGLRLAGFLIGAATLAAIFRRMIGTERLEAWRSPIDGINVLAMFVFAIAVMDGVGPAIANQPWFVATLLGATFTLALFQMAVMRLALSFFDHEKATSIALATGLRNMGLMVAALGLSIPETTWLWFAVGQFPIFFMPWIIEIVRKQRAQSS